MSKLLPAKIVVGLGTVALAATGGVANAVTFDEIQAQSSGEAVAAYEYVSALTDFSVAADAVASYEATLNV